MNQTSTKHPKALPFLFLSEMWERFGFYLMLGIFFLVLIAGVAWFLAGQDAAVAAWLQAYEYRQTIFISRMSRGRMGMLGIVSGAFGAFRTSVLKQLGGWDVHDCVNC